MDGVLKRRLIVLLNFYQAGFYMSYGLQAILSDVKLSYIWKSGELNVKRSAVKVSQHTEPPFETVFVRRVDFIRRSA